MGMLQRWQVSVWLGGNWLFFPLNPVVRIGVFQLI